jgi:hypothetical protein
MGEIAVREPYMKKAILLCLLIIVSASCRGETFFIVVSEIRDGEELKRPSPSQEGIIEAMFDLGFVSFDSGHYRPAADWTTMDFREPLAIARQGLAQFILAAEVRSVTRQREPGAAQQDSGRRDSDPPLAIDTSVRYCLFEVSGAALLAEEEMELDNSSKQARELSYSEFLHSVGREIAVRCIRRLKTSG